MARHDLLISFKPFTGVWKTQLFAAFPFPRRANDRRGAFPARPDTIRIFPIDRAVPRPRQPAGRGYHPASSSRDGPGGKHFSVHDDLHVGSRQVTDDEIGYCYCLYLHYFSTNFKYNPNGKRVVKCHVP